MGLLDYLEYGLGSSLFSFRARDEKLFTKGPAFADIQPTIDITSPDVGPSESTMAIIYTGLGEDRFPELEWSAPPKTKVSEYLLVVEDPDAPIPSPPTHGLYYAIPATTTKITASDITLKSGKGKKVLNGNFKLGQNIRGTHYGGPKPPLGHGPHRYFYQLIALKEPLDTTKLSEMATKKELAEAIVGNVAAWGAWIGIFEKKWK